MLIIALMLFSRFRSIVNVHVAVEKVWIFIYYLFIENTLRAEALHRGVVWQSNSLKN